VTILTGFLAAARPRCSTAILKEDHGQRIAVIENEFGEIGVDNQIIETGDEQIVMMNNGCICCTVRGDLIRILGSLKEKRDEGKLEFDRVVIETTAWPIPPGGADLLHRRRDRQLLPSRFDHHPGRREARAEAAHEFHEAQEQVGFADRILLSRRSRIGRRSEHAVQKTEKMNPRAPIKKVHFGDMPIEEVLDIRGFNLNAILQLDPEFLVDSHHEHHDEVDRSCSSPTSPSTARSWSNSSRNDPGLRPGSPALQGVLWM